MEKRKVKQYNLQNNDMSVKFGTMNRFNPIVLFTECKCWIKAQEDMDYTQVIDHIFKSVKHNIRHHLLESDFENQLIFDYSVNSDDMVGNKAKFLTFEIFFKQKPTNVVDMKRLSKNIDYFIQPILTEIKEEFNKNGFIVGKRRFNKL